MYPVISVKTNPQNALGFTDNICRRGFMSSSMPMRLSCGFRSPGNHRKASFDWGVFCFCFSVKPISHRFAKSTR